ncbi:MAG: hypothetical protein HZT40_08210 [Candidatus Thiothrix singaporensis]|uniref:Uncharacterized protein n=1 Tax=Candidatus Thiothrix singaporensis TaxID=2799669 RepID=A0A7L6AR08_9GAMM|nr:MAG: hypothetical protein HZT40_08210 [Candidatus Thiothrix singaporensis]
MTTPNTVELELINKLVSENDDPIDFILELQSCPETRNNPDAAHLAMQIWQEARQEMEGVSKAA